ncbi:MAG: hypothetical protein IJI14_18515 [Anaerolineaceae bacterium]|nr:hypothetical protein [Anaerolineaceae bacterium]
MKIVGYILSVICYIFGILFIWGAFGTPFDSNSLVIGIIMVGIGSVIMIIVTRKGKAEQAEKNVTYNIDLSGETKANKLVCQKCGAPLGKNDITLVAGVPTVTCPYCGVTYQITEEPKW